MTTQTEENEIWRVQHDLSFFVDVKHIWKSGLHQYVVAAAALNIRDVDKLRNVGIVIQRVNPSTEEVVKLDVKVVQNGQ